jgi:hypothetical protein
LKYLYEKPAYSGKGIRTTRVRKIEIFFIVSLFYVFFGPKLWLKLRVKKRERGRARR